MIRLVTVALAALALVPAAAATPPDADVRFATFNASLNRNLAGQFVSDISTPNNVQAKNAAETIQRVRPDVLLINEFDFDAAGDGAPPLPGQLPLDRPERRSADLLPVPLHGRVEHRHSVRLRPEQQRRRRRAGRRFRLRLLPGPVRNGGLLDVSDRRHGHPHLPEVPLEGHARRPAPGRSRHAGTGRLVLARRAERVPALLEEPLGPADPGREQGRPLPHQPPDAARLRRPRGPERRHGNFDEIRFWADYISPGKAGYIYDDGGGTGGLKPGSLFVIAGDQNSDPLDGDSIPGSIQLLLEHPLVNTTFTPESPGAVQQNALQGGANLTHRSDPRFDTADFADSAPGNLRADYVLPRRNMQIVDGARLLAAQHRSALPHRRDVPVPDLGPPARLDRDDGAVALSRT